MLARDAEAAPFPSRGENFSGGFVVKMRLKIPAAATTLALAALLAACNPQDGSAPATDSARQNTTPAANNKAPATPAAHSTPAAAATPNDGVRRVNIADSRAMAESGEAVIYDVRDKQAFEANHIKGAKLVPLAEVAARAAEFPKDKLVITYCA
jgi:rhodanese-like protein